jgi:Na+:H+ antiporter
MSVSNLISAIVVVVALCGYANARFVRLPDSIGITAVALVISLATVGLGLFRPDFVVRARAIAGQINFGDLVFHGLLGPLLFAGSLHVNVSALAQSRWVILTLATLGVILSTLIVGFSFFYVVQLLGAPLRLVDCLVFGALISPTDPVAALGLLGEARISPTLLTMITGEALFNDGTGVVAFSVLTAIAAGSQSAAALPIIELLAREALGGIAFGLIVGYIGFALLRSIDSYAVEILITLAMAMGGYALADSLGVSAPLAAVVMGLMIGNRGKHAMSELTHERLFSFWDLVDNLLNLLLFALIGLELATLHRRALAFAAPAAIAIPIALVARLISVAVPTGLLSRFRRFEPGCVRLLTWGGLRGALAIALALSLPEQSAAREPIVLATYAIALFSTLVQATTVEALARRWAGSPRPAA